MTIGAESANFCANSRMPRQITLKITRRADGRWCKRIDGHYLTWNSEAEARAAVLDIVRGRARGVAVTAHAIPPDPSLADIANAFRDARMSAVKPRTWRDYEAAIDSFLRLAGKWRRANELAPADFAAVRKAWADEVGPCRLDNRVQPIRTMFRWACETARLIDKLPWYGDSFDKSTAADKRKVRREHVAEHGERVFTKPELRKLLAKVNGPLRAFVLLGLNCGMYSVDVADLRAVDLKRVGRNTLIDNDRAKTGVRRKAVLWPDTLAAMKRCRRDDEGRFVTLHGNPWVHGKTNSIAQAMYRLLKRLGIHRQGVGFGSLRHTHVSAVGDHPDLNAARLVRGHQFVGIEEHYDFPNVKRIKAVTDLARRRLLTTS